MIPVSILRKSIAIRYRPVRVADGPITVRCRFIKNASWDRTERNIVIESQKKMSSFGPCIFPHQSLTNLTPVTAPGHPKSPPA